MSIKMTRRVARVIPVLFEEAGGWVLGEGEGEGERVVRRVGGCL